VVAPRIGVPAGLIVHIYMAQGGNTTWSVPTFFVYRKPWALPHGFAFYGPSPYTQHRRYRHEAAQDLSRRTRNADGIYNILPDFRIPRLRCPPAGCAPDLAAIFPMELITGDEKRYIEIPESPEAYRMFRLTRLSAPLTERKLDTPAGNLLQVRGGEVAGATNKHRNSLHFTIRRRGSNARRRNGAGQWGSALSLACRMFDMECKVYMVRVSYDQKPYRRSMIHAWGAEVVPSRAHKAGRDARARPHAPGSPRTAISEAVEDGKGRHKLFSRQRPQPSFSIRPSLASRPWQMEKLVASRLVIGCRRRVDFGHRNSFVRELIKGRYGRSRSNQHHAQRH
jgi:hypothetical protein